MSLPHGYNTPLLFINNRWVPPVRGNFINVINPHDEKVIGTVAAGTQEDVKSAIAAARAAFPGWAKTPGKERGAILKKMASEINRRKVQRLV